MLWNDLLQDSDAPVAVRHLDAAAVKSCCFLVILYQHSESGNNPRPNCRSIALRNDLLAGFDASVAIFEAWMPLLLLRAAQALGFFTSPGAATTSDELAAKIVPAYRRFTAEMLAMLQRAGVRRLAAVSVLIVQQPWRPQR